MLPFKDIAWRLFLGNDNKTAIICCVNWQWSCLPIYIPKLSLHASRKELKYEN